MIYDGALAANRVVGAGQLGLVSGDRCADHFMDRDRYHQPWKAQYGCHGSIVYSDADSVQGDLSSADVYSRDRGS